MQRLLQYIQHPKTAGRIIFFLALLLYVNTLPNGWAVDDGLVIHNSQAVRSGFAGLPAIFGQDYIQSSTGEKVDAIAGGRYRPLSPAIYAVCAELLARPAKDGTEKPSIDAVGHKLKDLGANTAFPHLMHGLNMLLYGVLCFLLYGVLLALMRDYSRGPLIAFLAALLFTVHPLHTEAVANAKGLDEILSLLLSLLSLQCFVLVVDDGRQKALKVTGGALCLFLAALAKENALTFIAIIPLSIWFFRKLPIGRLAMLCSPAVLGIACYIVLRMNAVGSLSLAAPDALNMMNNPFLTVAEGQKFAPLLPGSDVMVLQAPTTQSIVPMPASNRLATVAYTWLQYLRLAIFPATLSYDYYPKQIATYSFASPIVWLSLLVHIGALFWALTALRRRQLAAFGILFYFLSFSVVSNLIFPVGTNMAERFLFMPSVGLCIAAAAGLTWLAERYKASAVLGGIAIVAVLFSIRTAARNRDWKDNLTLMQHDLDVATGSAKIRSDYGEVVLLHVGEARKQATAMMRELSPDEQSEESELLRSTLPLYKEALDVYPMYGLVWYNLARTHQLLGEGEGTAPNERLTHLLTAIAAYGVTDVYKPRQYEREVDTMKSLCFAALGKLYGQQFGSMDKALEYLQTARRINSRNGYALFLLGTAYDIKGAPDSAYYFTRAAYETDTANRDYAENYAQIIQKLVGMNKMAKASLAESGRLLQETAKRNAGLPDDAPKKAAMIARTQLMLHNNDSLQARSVE